MFLTSGNPSALSASPALSGGAGLGASTRDGHSREPLACGPVATSILASTSTGLSLEQTEMATNGVTGNEVRFVPGLSARRPESRGSRLRCCSYAWQRKFPEIRTRKPILPGWDDLKGSLREGTFARKRGTFLYIAYIYIPYIALTMEIKNPIL